MKKYFLVCLLTFLVDIAYSQNQDCTTAEVVCSDQNIPGNSSGSGSSESFTIPSCCGSWGENQSSWFVISPTTTGTIAFTLTSGSGVDYDFAIWGPTASPICPPSGNPIRCSGSDGNANGSTSTGMAGGSGDTCEDPSGDDYINPINVNAPQVNKFYTILINNFTAQNNPFNLDWTGTASLTCTPLPIQLISFKAENSAKGNLVTWVVGSENQVSSYELAYSTDGKSFATIAKIDKSENSSSSEKMYRCLHDSPLSGIGYYALKTINSAGEVNYMQTISIDNTLKENTLRFFPNPNDGNFTLQYALPNEQNAQLMLYDLTGREVYSTLLLSENHQLYLSPSLPKGMYYGKVSTVAGVLEPISIVIR